MGRMAGVREGYLMFSGRGKLSNPGGWVRAPWMTLALSTQSAGGQVCLMLVISIVPLCVSETTPQMMLVHNSSRQPGH